MVSSSKIEYETVSNINKIITRELQHDKISTISKLSSTETEINKIIDNLSKKLTQFIENELFGKYKFPHDLEQRGSYVPHCLRVVDILDSSASESEHNLYSSNLNKNAVLDDAILIDSEVIDEEVVESSNKNESFHDTTFIVESSSHDKTARDKSFEGQFCSGSEADKSGFDESEFYRELNNTQSYLQKSLKKKRKISLSESPTSESSKFSVIREDFMS